MKVVAIKMGFYNGARRRPGNVFDMPEADKKMPAWVQPADKELPAILDDNARATAAAITAAGPKRPNTAPPKMDDLV